MNMEREIYNVKVEDIIPNRFQPRLTFDETALNELSASIKEHGIIQPLVLRKLGTKYEIIAGERRYKASCLAGLTHVPAVIVNLDDNVSAEVALVENLQRRDLSAIEEAKSYRKLLDRGYLTQEELAVKMGKNQSTIANKLRLLNLSEDVQNALVNNEISERHARSLLSLKDKSKEVELLRRIIKERLTVKQTDEAIKAINDGNTEEGSSKDMDQGIYKQVKPIDIDSLIREAENATPISKPDFDALLKNDTPVSVAANNTEPKKTIDPIEQLDIEDDLTGLDIFGGSLKEQLAQRNHTSMPTVDTIKPNSNMDLRAAINMLRECISNIEKVGFKVDTEEFDFEKTYQIVIDINKDDKA